MTPLPPVPGVIKVTLGWQCDGNTTAESVLHWGYNDGPPDAATCLSFATLIKGFANAQLKYLLNSINAVGAVTVLDLSSDSGAEATYGTPEAGTLTGSMLSAATCMVMNHTIGRHYRGGRPRTYIPGGDEGQLASTGKWDSSFVTLCDTNWGSFINDVNGESEGDTTLTEFGCVSYFLNGARRTDPLFEAILASNARVRIGSQRRRLKTA